MIDRNAKPPHFPEGNRPHSALTKPERSTIALWYGEEGVDTHCGRKLIPFINREDKQLHPILPGASPNIHHTHHYFRSCFVPRVCALLAPVFPIPRHSGKSGSGPSNCSEPLIFHCVDCVFIRRHRSNPIWAG